MSEAGVIHVEPVDDLVPHDCDGGAPRVCGPDVEFRDNGWIIVSHHSLDGREAKEAGR